MSNQGHDSHFGTDAALGTEMSTSAPLPTMTDHGHDHDGGLSPDLALAQVQAQAQAQAQAQSQGTEFPIATSSSSNPHTPVAPGHGQGSGAVRKQNVACDACRTKKIRCQRTSIFETCGQCAAKGSQCTSHYVEQLQSKAKRGKEPRKKRRLSHEINQEDMRWGMQAGPSNGVWQPTLEAEPIPHRRLPSESQRDLVRYFFAPSAVTHDRFGYSDLSSLRQCDIGESDLWEEMGGAVWREPPTSVHASLTDEQIKALAEDLIETFFAFAHCRWPMLDPITFRERYADPDHHALGPLPHTHIACTLGFGARMSDCSTFAKDREEVSARDEKHELGRTRSRITQLIVIRAREVADVNKVWRVPTVENVQACLMLEMMLAQMTFRREKYSPHFTATALRHVQSMGLNSRSRLLAIVDEKKRADAVFLWWLARFSDAIISTWYGQSIMLGITETESESSSIAIMRAHAEGGMLHGLTAPTEGVGVEFYAAAQWGVTMAQKLCNGLWTAGVRERGIATDTLTNFIESNLAWKRNFGRLGVPKQWPEDWDFFAAISACVNDCIYHGLWLVVRRAIKDIGLAEGSGVETPWSAQLLQAHKRIEEESKHAAMRIAALVAVLTENGYLRLDPIIAYHPIYYAGHYLAETGRAECRACVAGLKQFAITFPAMWDVAEEIEAAYMAQTQEERNRPAPISTSSYAPMSMNPSAGSGPGSSGSAGTSRASPASSHHVPLYIAPPPARYPSQPTPQPHPQHPSHLSSSQAGSSGHWTNGVPGVKSHERWNVNRSEAVLAGSSFQPLPPNATHREVWPDGTPVPPRDVAWTLFDWLHQDGRQVEGNGTAPGVGPA